MRKTKVKGFLGQAQRPVRLEWSQPLVEWRKEEATEVMRDQMTVQPLKTV